MFEQPRPVGKGGGVPEVIDLSSVRRSIYVGFYWKPSNPFTGYQHYNKMVWHAHTGSGFYFGFQGSPLPIDPDRFQYGFALYGACNDHLPGWGTPCDNPNVNPWNYYPVSAARVRLGEWQLVEYFVLPSSGLDSKDGRIVLWIDGEKVSDDSTVNIVPGNFEEMKLTSVWDGSAEADSGRTSVDYHRIDHVKVCRDSTID